MKIISVRYTTRSKAVIKDAVYYVKADNYKEAVNIANARLMVETKPELLKYYNNVIINELEILE